jgi:conjugative relaxase-like TrwC/TraI family protein
MFTMAKIKDGSTYLGRHLTANDYYCEQESVTGHWFGQGAARLGLSGGISAGNAAFENLRQNRMPDGSGKLTPRDSDRRIRFFDFQCSAPKSVSVMAITVGDERLLAAHDQAATRGFQELEKFAATQANTALARSNRITGNVVAAVFRHTASRALDPQSHTHFVTANATWDEASSSWRALTEFEMLSAVRYAGKVYQNELAGLCRKLGYEITEGRDERGNVTGFELAGVSSEIRDRFSKRRAEVEHGIEEFKRKHGRAPSKTEVHAITVRTREAKLAEITTPQVLVAQRGQLSPLEWKHLDTLKTQAEGRAGGPVSAVPTRERESLQLAIGHIYERRSVALGHEVLAEALNQNLGRLDLERLHAQAEKSGLVPLDDQPWSRTSFATVRGLAEERRAVAFVDKTKSTLPELGHPVPGDTGLSAEQRKAVADVLATRDQVVCLRGAAGVGKTTVLKELNRALVADGRQVFYCAPTTSATDTMRQDGLADATTVSGFLQNVAINDRDRLRGAVLVVDEAGLASNRQGAEILQLAERHKARVVFLGDSRQHTAVEAGDFLRVLETHSQMHRVELTDIRRQTVAEYRAAVRLMAAGAVRTGLEQLDRLGWVRECQADYLRAAVDEYLVHSKGGTNPDAVLAVTPTWAENRTFTEILRTELKRNGVLGAGEIVTIHDPLPWTRAQKSKAENYAPGMAVTFNRATSGFSRGESATVVQVEQGQVLLSGERGERRLPLRRGSFEVSKVQPLEVCPGDKLLVRANDHAGGFINGEVLTVSGISAGKIRTVGGRVIETALFRQFCHGFAVTSHKSQSKTADHVVVAAEHLDARSAYVACSRGRQSCAVLTPEKESLLARMQDDPRRAALDLLGQVGPGQSPAPLLRPDSAAGRDTSPPHPEWIERMQRVIGNWHLYGAALREWISRTVAGESSATRAVRPAQERSQNDFHP